MISREESLMLIERYAKNRPKLAKRERKEENKSIYPFEE